MPSTANRSGNPDNTFDDTAQTRKPGPNCRYEDDRVRIASDFECGNACNIQRHPSLANVYTIDVEPEPGDHRFAGMAYYYCFSITALKPGLGSVRLHLRGSTNGAFGGDQKHIVLRHQGQWSELGADHAHPMSGLTDVLEIEVPLPAGTGPDTAVFVSNFHWHPYTEMMRYLGAIQHPDATVRHIANSVEGRPIHRVDIGPAGAPTLVMAATPQASEMGTWTCRAVIDWLLSDAPQAVVLRRRHRFVLLPMTNPDGAVQGLGVSHPVGRFPFFEGELTALDDNPLPEMKAVWRVLCDERPWLFIEWHSNNWHRRPGHVLLRFRPELVEDPLIRRRWEAFDRRLVTLPDTHHGNWTSRTEGMYQVSLCYQAITRLGCIAHMIKHHDKYPIRQTAEHAIACVIAAVEAYDQNPGDR